MKERNNSLIYDTHEHPKTIKEWVLYAVQMLMAVFVATVLISTICGTPVDAGLLGACLGTLTYQVITKFKSPVFISNSGATVSAVIGALALGGGENYFAVFIGGLVILAIYAAFSLIIKWRGIDAINKLFPPYIVGPVTIVIGLNLATFIFGYVGGFNVLDVLGEGNVIDVMHSVVNPVNLLVAIATMIVIAITSHYFKGFLKTIPFLIGLVFGFIVCLVIELISPMSFGIVAELQKVDQFFACPDFAFGKWSSGLETFDFGILMRIISLFVPVSICALCEHYSDHAVMSNIIGHDLTTDPGLHRTLLADGTASVIGTIFGGQPNTSYGESTAMVGFSKVASVKVVSLAAIMMGILAFIEPVQAFISAVPNCVFGGCAMILYGYIACSGLKTLMRNKVDLENNKNLIVVSVILTIGVSGVYLFDSAFAGVSLAMVLGIILNLVLRSPKTNN